MVASSPTVVPTAARRLRTHRRFASWPTSTGLPPLAEGVLDYRRPTYRPATGNPVDLGLDVTLLRLSDPEVDEG